MGVLACFCDAFFAIISSWLLADVYARLFLTSKFLMAFTGLAAGALTILVFSAGLAPRDEPGLASEQVYSLIYALPPAGWVLPISGLVKSTTVLGWLNCLLAMGFIVWAWFAMGKSLELVDIRVNGAMRPTALRRGWLTIHESREVAGRLFRGALTAEQKSRRLAVLRGELLTTTQARTWFARMWSLLTLGNREIAMLGLLGLKPASRSFKNTFAGACVSLLPFIVVMNVLNQYVSFQGLPPYVRLLTIVSLVLPLADFRQLQTFNPERKQTVAGGAARVLFPFSVNHVLFALIKDRMISLLYVAPGLVLYCLALSSTTDIPVDFVVNTAVLAAAVDAFFPLFATVCLVSGNFLSSWRTWLLVMHVIFVIAIAYPLTLLMGVGGAAMSSRFELAWCVVGGVSLALVSVYFYMRFLVERGVIDEGLKPVKLPGVRS